jgi:hypothetical protein
MEFTITNYQKKFTVIRQVHAIDNSAFYLIGITDEKDVAVMSLSEDNVKSLIKVLNATLSDS